MAFPVDLRRCQILGLAGTAFLAAGGETAGALPVRDLLHPASARAALGLVGVYFGLVLLIAAWALLGRLVRGPRPPAPRALLTVLAVWAAPLLLAPPLFSRDVYSYLAQGAMVDAHMDVYAHGPSRLGGPLADEVAPLWRHTGAPYGPVFLAVAAALSALTRDEVPAGLFGMRLVALAGVALMAAALPRLARHSGADPAAALWLGALNPLVLLHLVAGAHNDAVMLGLLGIGLVAALGRWPYLGAVLVTLAALVKAPAVLGLAAVVVLQVRAGRGTAKALVTTAAAARRGPPPRPRPRWHRRSPPPLSPLPSPSPPPPSPPLPPPPPAPALRPPLCFRPRPPFALGLAWRRWPRSARRSAPGTPGGPVPHRRRRAQHLLDATAWRP
ncbi:hypothetical protein SVIOM74S_00482 [Streptomyces violarus]